MTDVTTGRLPAPGRARLLLLDARISALAAGSVDRTTTAVDLLDFWLAHPLAVAVLLDRAEGTVHAGYPAAFVRRLVTHVERSLGTPVGIVHRELLELVFDNTRRALAQILRTARDEEHARALVAAFWSYRIPGLDGLVAFIREDAAGA